MAIKIFTIGDPHSKKSNQAELKICADKIAQKITETQPDAIVILGDLADNHDRVYISALNGTVYFVDVICSAAAGLIKPAKVYYIIGNHDCESNQIFLTDNHTFNAFKKWPNFIVVDKVLRLKTGTGPIVMCPYVPAGRFLEALDTIGRDRWADAKVIFCHQEFLGSKLSGLIASKSGDKWDDNNPMIISGHIHNYDRLQENILYPGELMYSSFGDDDKPARTISLFEIDGGKFPQETKIDLGVLKKLTINLTIDEAKEYVPPDNAHIRVNLTGTTQEHNEFKQTEKYAQLLTMVKIIPQHVDKIVVQRNTQRLGYLDILAKECEKEDEAVKEALQEVLNGDK